GQLPPARGGERVEAGPSVVRRCAPLCGNPAALLEPLQGGIERAVLHEQLLGRSSLDCESDSVPVLRPEDERPKDQKVERPLEDLEPFFLAFRPLSGRHPTRVSLRSGRMST